MADLSWALVALIAHSPAANSAASLAIRFLADPGFAWLGEIAGPE